MYTIRGNIPSKSNCYRIVTINGKSKLAKSEALTKYEKSFYLQCPERGRDVEGYFALKAKVYFSSNRPDLDNSLKILLDCLQHTGTIRNDRYCTRIEIEKMVDRKDPRVEYEVIPVLIG